MQNLKFLSFFVRKKILVPEGDEDFQTKACSWFLLIYADTPWVSGRESGYTLPLDG